MLDKGSQNKEIPVDTISYQLARLNEGVSRLGKSVTALSEISDIVTGCRDIEDCEDETVKDMSFEDKLRTHGTQQTLSMLNDSLNLRIEAINDLAFVIKSRM